MILQMAPRDTDSPVMRTSASSPSASRIPHPFGLLLAFLLLSAGFTAAKEQGAWQLMTESEWFEGSFGVVSADEVKRFAGGELALGCPVEDPRLPALVLTAQEEFGEQAQQVYARVPGSSVTSQNSWSASRSQLTLSGFEASLLLADIVALPAPRSLFLRLEDGAGGPWSFGLTGIRDVLAQLPCGKAFR